MATAMKIDPSAEAANVNNHPQEVPAQPTRTMRRLIICCPHCAAMVTDQEVMAVEGGPLILVTDIPVLAKAPSLLKLSAASEALLYRLRQWMGTSGLVEVTLLGHPNCTSELLGPLDLETTRRHLHPLARDLREEFRWGTFHSRVVTEFTHDSDRSLPIDPHRPRNRTLAHSGEIDLRAANGVLREELDRRVKSA